MSKKYYAKVYRDVVGLGSARYNTWVMEDLITATVAARGSGTRALWTEKDMVEGLTAKLLIDAGLKVIDAFELAARARKSDSNHIVTLPVVSGISIKINKAAIESKVHELLKGKRHV